MRANPAYTANTVDTANTANTGNAAGTPPVDAPVVRSDIYRSYVIRVRRRLEPGPEPHPTTRLDVEDLLEGGTATMSGEAASSFAASLERLVDAARPDPTGSASRDRAPDLSEGPAAS